MRVVRFMGSILPVDVLATALVCISTTKGFYSLVSMSFVDAGVGQRVIIVFGWRSVICAWTQIGFCDPHTDKFCWTVVGHCWGGCHTALVDAAQEEVSPGKSLALLFLSWILQLWNREGLFIVDRMEDFLLLSLLGDTMLVHSLWKFSHSDGCRLTITSFVHLT